MQWNHKLHGIGNQVCINWGKIHIPIYVCFLKVTFLHTDYKQGMLMPQAQYETEAS